MIGLLSTSVALAAKNILPMKTVVLGVQLGKTPIDEAAKKFNKKAKVRHGEVGGFESYVCFKLRDRSDLVLKFAAGKEMSDGIVNEVRVLQNKAALDSGCQETNTSEIALGQIKLPLGITIGMSQSMVERLLSNLNLAEGYPENVKAECDEVKEKTFRGAEVCLLCRSYRLNFEKGLLIWLSYLVTESDCVMAK
jgi:hypothetical protein